MTELRFEDFGALIPYTLKSALTMQSINETQELLICLYTGITEYKKCKFDILVQIHTSNRSESSKLQLGHLDNIRVSDFKHKSLAQVDLI